MFEDFDDYDGYQARELARVCPYCERLEPFCDTDHGPDDDVQLAARLNKSG